MTMTREEIEQLYVEEPNSFETDREEQWYKVGLKEGLVTADSHPHWIPVEEELPPENGKTQQSISVWATNGLISGEFRYNFDTKTWTDMWGDPFDITYWMLLPQLPRKEE